VFTSLALFGNLVPPLNAFPWVINTLMEAWVSIRRINRFLQLSELDLIHYYHRGGEATPTSGEEEGVEATPSSSEAEDVVVSVRGGHFTWEKNGSSEDNGSSEEKGSGGSEGGDELVGATYTVFAVSSMFVVYVCVCALTQGQFIGVVGKVGSGKTSLLAAINAEMCKVHGEVSSDATWGNLCMCSLTLLHTYNCEFILNIGYCTNCLLASYLHFCCCLCEGECC